MGNRALVQFTDGDDFSPVTYLHWNGAYVADYIAELVELMSDRMGDLPYSAARFIGICHSHSPGNLSLGVWNYDKKLNTEDSHGDEGCFIVNVNNWSIEHID